METTLLCYSGSGSAFLPSWPAPPFFMAMLSYFPLLSEPARRCSAGLPGTSSPRTIVAENTSANASFTHERFRLVCTIMGAAGVLVGGRMIRAGQDPAGLSECTRQASQGSCCFPVDWPLAAFALVKKPSGGARTMFGGEATHVESPHLTCAQPTFWLSISFPGHLDQHSAVGRQCRGDCALACRTACRRASIVGSMVIGAGCLELTLILFHRRHLDVDDAAPISNSPARSRCSGSRSSCWRRSHDARGSTSRGGRELVARGAPRRHRRYRPEPGRRDAPLPPSPGPIRAADHQACGEHSDVVPWQRDHPGLARNGFRFWFGAAPEILGWVARSDLFRQRSYRALGVFGNFEPEHVELTAQIIGALIVVAIG